MTNIILSVIENYYYETFYLLKYTETENRKTFLEIWVNEMSRKRNEDKF